ncbi:MAG TPA: LysR family transcriptional regulator [Hypericibacter adhaerens]|uniref:LysR family transcriptional regulator n=1 Tax=Hypericibacter adhaerens TaxID=2602016 RepID=A0A5J6MUC4_9PROT|nr:LysR family transcriptional regulator [Hypericibacter adhaerens]QEX20754.1 LysR family transcriptional regulator [Hypericibacter adhaerens]HWA45313.1 LysR family transcriptional regulator [Hypericibacter adhaerens]
MSISLRQIRYFIATAEAGKVSAAASTLGVSQSAVTEAIKVLERETGARLFRRYTNGVALTSEGNQFLLHARNVTSAVQDALRAPRQTRVDLTGRVSVGMTYTVAGYFAPAPLARFRRSFPGVELELHEMDRGEIEERLVAGSLDLAIILTSNLRNADEIDTETLIQSKRRLWLPANHPLSHAGHVTLADVAPEPYIMLLVDEAEQTAIGYWHKRGFSPNVVFRTTSVEAVRSMVATGAGVAILSDMVYRPWSLEGDRIEARLMDDDVPSMDVGLAWKRGAKLDPCAKALRDFCHITYNAAGAATV